MLHYTTHIYTGGLAPAVVVIEVKLQWLADRGEKEAIIYYEVIDSLSIAFHCSVLPSLLLSPVCLPILVVVPFTKKNYHKHTTWREKEPYD